MARGLRSALGVSAEVHEAMNPALSKAELLPLGGSRSVAVRAIVAARLDCPLGLMVTLAHDYHPDVRCAVASNPSAQRSVLAYLAADRHIEVVRAVLGNPSLPSDILDELALHKKAAVRDVATERLNGLTAQVRQSDEEHRTAEDARVPEVAEHVPPGALAGVDGVREAGVVREVGHVADAGATAEFAAAGERAASDVVERQASSTDDLQSAQRWTRTAPVRGFRVTG